ncbi:MAG: hypothetical protein AN487_24465, partial [Anabaena sp. CRKS33]
VPGGGQGPAPGYQQNRVPHPVLPKSRPLQGGSLRRHRDGHQDPHRRHHVGDERRGLQPAARSDRQQHRGRDATRVAGEVRADGA